MASTPNGYSYIYENVGIDPTSPGSTHNGFEYVYENVGILRITTPNGFEYVYENIGALLGFGGGVGAGYIYEGDVSTHTPIPHLWFVKPTSGRPGDGITLYGHGVGSTQPTYSGVVQFLESDGVTWTNVSATSWTFVAAGAHAYDSLREIDPDLLIITMEHEEVAIVIPSDAVPPGHRLRFRTDGP